MIVNIQTILDILEEKAVGGQCGGLHFEDTSGRSMFFANSQLYLVGELERHLRGNTTVDFAGNLVER